jgi:hypothetical protein
MSNPVDTDTPSVQSSGMVTTSNIENANILTEYQTLRDDILKRIEFRYKLINLLLVVAGVFFSIGLELEHSSSVLLIYPILAFFLMAGWAHNGVIMVKISDYLRREIEVNTVGLKWHSHLTTSHPKFSSFSFLGTVSTSGLVLTTQLLALLLVYTLTGFKFAQVEIVLFLASLAAIGATLLLLRQTTQLRRSVEES